jgi:hypothetical protein
MKKESVKLISVCEGLRTDYLEPSRVCAAQHALSILDHEEGCVQAIEVNGKLLWEFKGKKSLQELEELAAGECVK